MQLQTQTQTRWEGSVRACEVWALVGTTRGTGKFAGYQAGRMYVKTGLFLSQEEVVVGQGVVEDDAHA